MSFLRAIASGIRCMAMWARTLLVFPYSLSRQTVKGAKSGFLLVPQNELTALAQAAFVVV